MSNYIKLLFILIISSFISLNSALAEPKVCFSDKEAIDIAVLLDASEKDIHNLSDCKKLVKELYTELTIKDNKIIDLTDQIIKANKEIIRYKGKYTTVRNIAVGTSILSGILLILQFAPLL